MALESSTEVSLVLRRKIRKENPEEDSIQPPCRKRIRRIKHPDHEPEPSYEFFNKIPDSMLSEILYRLRCRTVHQSQLVSKSWYSLISDPLFARGFIHHHRHQDSYSDSDPFNLLYKVVVLVHSHNEPKTTQLHMEIFSSEIGKWCKSVVSSPRVLNPVRNSFKGAHDVVACNGKLHWMDIEEYGMIKGFVVFDPFNDARRCHYIELPKNLPPDLSFGAFRCGHMNFIATNSPDFSFGAFRGRLRIFLNPEAKLNHTFSSYVWELEDYNNAGTWCMKHEVCSENMVYEDSRLDGLTENCADSLVEFLAFHPNNGEIVFFKFRHYLVVCNMSTRELQLAGKLRRSYWSEIFVFLLSQPLWPTPVPPPPLPFECSNNC
uniref:F-box domain-containing protein n=1 Tax=Quercus lobata TaxID=97700 RepID=A0A7N2R836_QUELO